MQDSLQTMNTMMNDYFAKAIENANSYNSCKPDIFEDALHSLTGGAFWSEIEIQVEKAKHIDKRIIDKSKSVYQDITFIDGPALLMAKLGFLLRIGDLYIGSDKFGHFIDQGFYYYRSKSIEDGMRYGEMTEATYYGLFTTGVYSYGDLAANYEGYNFWSSLVKGPNPYVSCRKGVWTQRIPFDWSVHINAALDEGLNCSTYKNEDVTRAVYNRIEALGMTCPVRNGYCDEMRERYGYLAPRIVSPACFY